MHENRRYVKLGRAACGDLSSDYAPSSLNHRIRELVKKLV